MSDTLVFTVRFALLSSSYYSQAQIMAAFAPHLKAAGYEILQTPSISNYIPSFKVTKSGNYKTMAIAGPPGQKPITVTSAAENAFEGVTPRATGVAWNISRPATGPHHDLAALLFQIRRETLYDAKTDVGLGWYPVIHAWETAPQHSAPYPERPPMPAGVTAPVPAASPVYRPYVAPAPAPAPVYVAPAPVYVAPHIAVAPKPAPAPVPKPSEVIAKYVALPPEIRKIVAKAVVKKQIAAPAPAPVAKPSLFSNWKVLLGAGAAAVGLGLLAFTGKKSVLPAALTKP